MKKKILIAYGTRFGSTKEVSEKLATQFEKAGCETFLLDLKKTPAKQWPSPKGYNGTLVGSSIKRGEWMKEAKLFLQKNQEYLRGDAMLGVFVCCASAADQDKRRKVREEYIATVLNELDVRAVMYDAFGGVIDFSQTSTKGWLDKKILQKVHKDDPLVRKNERNDLRDWDQIRAFGEKFAHFVNNRD